MATAGAAPPTAGAPVHERAPRRRLPGTPDQPFGDRVVMWGEGAGSVIRDLLLLVRRGVVTTSHARAAQPVPAGSPSSFAAALPA